MAKKLIEVREALRQELGDDVATPTLFTDDDQLDRWIVQAVRLVSKYRPLYTSTTFSPQSKVSRYAAPADMLRLERVVWIPSSIYGPWNEVKFMAVYEPVTDEINVLDFGRIVSIPTGEVITIEFTKAHTAPTVAAASTIPDEYEDAMIYFAAEHGFMWLARKVAAGNRGVMAFVRGRYEEKGEKSVKSMVDLATASRAQGLDILGAEEPAVIATAGKVPLHPRPTGAGSPRS